MRTVIDLPKEQIDSLSELCTRDGISRTEAIRRAVDCFLESHKSSKADRAFGILADRKVDSRKYIDELRSEWER